MTARTLVLASRPVSWINTAFPFAAAYLMTGTGADPTLILGSIFFLVPYNLALYGINDVYDHDSDLANPRKGGAEGALVPRSQHRQVWLWSILTTVPFLVALALAGNAVSTGVLVLSMAAVLAYSVPGLRFKEVPFLDSITSALHFVTPALFGLALTEAAPTRGLVASMVAFFLWACASHAFGAVQDIAPDRAAGLSSIATLLGPRRTTRLALVCWLGAGAVMLLAPWPGSLAGVLAVPYLVNVAPYRTVSDADAGTTNRAWRRFLGLNYASGFVVTLLLLWTWRRG